MKSLLLPGIPPIPASFSRNRFDSDPSRFSLKLGSGTPTPTDRWSSLPSPPMSGSPPLEQRSEPQQIAGHRRKRSDTPVLRSPSRTRPSSVDATATTTTLSLQDSAIERQRTTTAAVTNTGSSSWPPVWPPTYLPPRTDILGAPSASSVTRSPPPTLFASQPGVAVGPSRSLRKPKAHVPSACVNCKKKHLRCDNSRPCHRCLQSGKESSCVDVQHKKRGRPPLKTDDGSSHLYPEHGRSPEIAPAVTSPLGQISPSRPRVLSMSYPTQAIAPRGHFRTGRLEDTGPSQTFLGSNPTTSSISSWSLANYPPTSVGHFTPSNQTLSSASPPLPSNRRHLSGYAITPPERTSLFGYHHELSRYSSSHAPSILSTDLGPPPARSYSLPSIQQHGQHGRHGRQSQEQSPLSRGHHLGAGSIYAPRQSIAPELRLPPIQPAPPGISTYPAIAQHQQRQAQHHQQHQQQDRGERDISNIMPPSENESSRQPDPKRPRMSLRDIVNPRNA